MSTSHTPTFFKRNPQLIAYVMIVVAAVLAMAWQNHLGNVRRDQICYAEIEDRLLISDIVNFVATAGGDRKIPEDLPPELKSLFERNRNISEEFSSFAEQRLNIPPTICKGTGITEDSVREDQIRMGLRERNT